MARRGVGWRGYSTKRLLRALGNWGAAGSITGPGGECRRESLRLPRMQGHGYLHAECARVMSAPVLSLREIMASSAVSACTFPVRFGGLKTVESSEKTLASRAHSSASF